MRAGGQGGGKKQSWWVFSEASASEGTMPSGGDFSLLREVTGIMESPILASAYS